MSESSVIRIPCPSDPVDAIDVVRHEGIPAAAAAAAPFVVVFFLEDRDDNDDDASEEGREREIALVFAIPESRCLGEERGITRSEGRDAPG